MKKSDYLKRRASHWLQYFQDPESISSEDHASGLPPAQRALIDAQAAEAAGVVWEPEGPPELPAHLIVVKTGYNQGRLACQVVNNAIAELTLEELDEVKRRCEAWPELEKALGAMVAGNWGKAGALLNAVLRGDPR